MRDQLATGRAGAFFFAPSGTAHTFANFSARQARMLITCTPAGFEEYLDRLAAGEPAEPPPGEAIAVRPPIGASDGTAWEVLKPMTDQNTNTKDQILELGRTWAAAERTGDAAAVGPLLADDFILVGPLGSMLDKEQYLGSRRSGDLKHESFDWGDVRIRVYGESAVAVGTQTQKSTYQGRDASGRFRANYLHILGAMGVVAALCLEWTIVFRLRSAETAELVRVWLGLSAVKQTVGPASLAVLLIGGLYMAATHWGGDGWIVFGLAVLLLIAALAYNGIRLVAIVLGVVLIITKLDLSGSPLTVGAAIVIGLISVLSAWLDSQYCTSQLCLSQQSCQAAAQAIARSGAGANSPARSPALPRKARGDHWRRRPCRRGNLAP